MFCFQTSLIQSHINGIARSICPHLQNRKKTAALIRNIFIIADGNGSTNITLNVVRDISFVNTILVTLALVDCRELYTA